MKQSIEQNSSRIGTNKNQNNMADQFKDEQADDKLNLRASQNKAE